MTAGLSEDFDRDAFAGGLDGSLVKSLQDGFLMKRSGVDRISGQKQPRRGIGLLDFWVCHAPLSDKAIRQFEKPSWSSRQDQTLIPIVKMAAITPGATS